MKIINFWTENYPEAAAACKTQFPETVKQTVSQADLICENTFLFCGHWEMERTHIPVTFSDRIDWEHNPAGDPEWTYAFNRHSFLMVLAKAWQYTGEEKYLAAAKRLLTDWIHHAPLTNDSKATSWRAIETGLRCESWLHSFAIFGSALSTDQAFMELADASLQCHADWLLKAHSPFQRLSNWGILQNHGLFLLGLTFQNEEWCETAINRLTEEVHVQLMADGSHWEQSPLYHCEVLHCLLDTVLAARKAKYSLPETFLLPTNKMAHALAFMLRPDGKLLCQSDSDEIDARDLLVLAACLFHDPLLKRYAGNHFQEENLWDIYEDLADYDALAVGDHRGSIALADSGNYMLWGDTDKDSSFLHMHCGCLGSGHGHADLLHVDLVSHGETILSDSGRYTYVDNAQRKAIKSPSAHNTIVVDDKDFSTYQSAWYYNPIANPVKGEYRFTPDADYINGMHLGYLKEGVFMQRRVIRIDRDIFVIWDNAFTTEHTQEHSYKRFFHFGLTGEVSLQDRAVSYHGKNCHASMIFPEYVSALHQTQAPISIEYNRLEESACLIEEINAAGDLSLPVVIATDGISAGRTLSVEFLPVSLQKSGILLPDSQAQALQICYGGQEWVLIVVHQEVISEVDLFSAGGYSGYGKILLFGSDSLQGTCLAW